MEEEPHRIRRRGVCMRITLRVILEEKLDQTTWRMFVCLPCVTVNNGSRNRKFVSRVVCVVCRNKRNETSWKGVGRRRQNSGWLLVVVENNQKLA